MSKPITRSLQALQRCEYSRVPQCPQPRLHPDTQSTPRRTFATTSRQHASQMGRAIRPTGAKQPAAPSMGLQMKKMQEQAIRNGQMPHDVGLLPDTYIMPHGRQLPSWISNTKGRWILTKKLLKTRAVEFWSAMAYRWFLVRPRPRMNLSTIPEAARDLHKGMYTHFAAGNLAPIEGRICEGLLASLKRRIGQRPPNSSLRWTVHKYLSKPKRVSYKAAVYPKQKGAGPEGTMGLVQTVVRIHSLQSLQHIRRVTVRDAAGKLSSREVLVDAAGKELPASEQGKEGEVPKDAKESVEFFVIQKSLRAGKEGPWMVWGTTEEMTLEKLRGRGNRGILQMMQGQ